MNTHSSTGHKTGVTNPKTSAQEDVKSGAIGSGGASTTENAGDRANSGAKSSSAQSAGDAACRRDSIEFALSLHRGKDKPASDIVREAAVIEAYIHEGKVPDPVPAPAPTGGVNVPPG